MTRGDLIVICSVAALALLALPVSGIALSSGSDVVALTGPMGTTHVPLDEPGHYRVEGSEGSVEFEVRDGRVRAISAQCSDQICVRSGAAAPGRPIVCAPNRVAATVRSTSKGELDAITR